AAALCPAGADAGIIVAIIEVVVVAEFFACLDVLRRDDPDVPVDLIRLAIRVTGMVDECGDASAVDDVHAVVKAEQVGVWVAFVELIGAFAADKWAGVLNDVCALLYGFGGVDAGGVYGG